MYMYSFNDDNDQLPLLDKEFDKMDIAPSLLNQSPVGPTFSCDERAWDDQLDNGEEMSL